MNDLQLATLVVGVILAFCASIGIVTKINLDRKKKPKKLSKRQKRELSNN